MKYKNTAPVFGHVGKFIALIAELKRFQRLR